MAYIFLPPFLTMVYNQERLILETIYVVNKEILQFLGPKYAGYDRARTVNVYYSFFRFE